MRPDSLFSLFAPLKTLQGVGPKTAPLLEKLCGPYLVNLLWHKPVQVIHRRRIHSIKEARDGEVVTLLVMIDEHGPPKKPSLPYRIACHDIHDFSLTLTFFAHKGDYLTKLYPVNKQLAISGRFEIYRGVWQMSHPDYVLPADKISDIPEQEAVYPLTEGLGQRFVHKAIAQTLAALPALPEWHDASIIARHQWPPWADAVRQLHHPHSQAEVEADTPYKQRLAYDELLADQLSLAVIRHHHRAQAGRPLQPTSKLTGQLKNLLPFQLTNSQLAASAEIAADMQSGQRMSRLLQGDVGSGKTIVALLAMLHAAEAGAQSALLAPTELLAKQHFNSINHYLEQLHLPCAFLSGKMKASERKSIATALQNGAIKIVVGTHALIQENVELQNLGLAIIDEQHRFGVQQRLQLADKGQGVHILSMTATPIPRTLAMTAYGDMDCSVLKEKPAGRKPIETRMIDSIRLDEVTAALKRQIASGTQAYWVCPLVAESEKLDLAAAEERYAYLQSKLGIEHVGLVHGQMNVAERDKVMARFAANDLAVLVATTVIEVGVDVPHASVMIIEHAERFGLAQLHQLRGRVGRGSAASSCLLLYTAPLGPLAAQRLALLRETEDGFRIAEEDLRLRGAGELLGTKQSGLPDYKVANLTHHQNLLLMARDEARLIIDKNATLSGARGDALKTLLYLFQKDSAVRLFAR